MSEQQAAPPKKPFGDLVKQHASYPMLLIAIYALFHIKTLLQTILGFSIRGSKDSNTCKSCHRSWEAGDSGGNFMNIARTGMCKNCYGNYNSLKGFIGK